MKRKKLLIVIALLLVCIGTLTSGASATPVTSNSHVLLQIPDIQGETTMSMCTKCIELSDVEFSSQIPVSLPQAQNRTIGIPKLDDILVTRQVDTISSAIFKKHMLTITAGSGSNPYNDFVIYYLDDSGNPYLKYTLKNALINTYKISNKARFAPEESFSVNYTAISVATWDSRTGWQQVFNYDIALNKLN